MEWQPIETAPQDGTKILGVYIYEVFSPDYSIVSWSDSEQCWFGWCDGELSIQAQGDVYTDYHNPHLTHWMPLPKPPAT